MSASAGQANEPDLVPLLDVVLQLVMFFMLTANFVMEQVNESIRLPEAISAKSLDRNQESYIILNVNELGQVLIGREEPEVLDTQVKVRNYMRQQYEQDRERVARRGRAKDWESGKGRSVIIIRADKSCNFRQVYEVMQACRQAGYSNLQLRAIQVAGN